MQAQPWHPFACANGPVFLGGAGLLLGLVFWAALVLVVIETLGDRQPVALLQGLRRFDGFGHFPLAEPDRAAEADPAGDDVDVVVISVLVANRSPSCVLGKLHLLHKVAGDGVPLLSAELLAWWQRKRRVPQVTLHVRAQRTHGGQLAGQLSRPGASQRAADDLWVFQPCGLLAFVHQVTHEAGSAAPSSNARLHASSSWSAGSS